MKKILRRSRLFNSKVLLYLNCKKILSMNEIVNKVLFVFFNHSKLDVELFSLLDIAQ